jgi:hypothetical protein
MKQEKCTHLTYRHWFAVALVIGAMGTLALATWIGKGGAKVQGGSSSHVESHEEPVRPLRQR